MADLTMPDQLQASLLDRLTDHAPSVREEPLDARVTTWRGLKQAVLRDLTWLFNATRLELRGDMTGFPEVQQSVINYGLPTFSGLTVSTLDLSELEATLQRGIALFEPRLLASTLQVTARLKAFREDARATDDLECHNVITIELRGQLRAQPVPIDLLVRAEIDLETGGIEIKDQPSA